MRLLDECIGQRSLAKALIIAGHDVMRSVDELGGGVDDDAVFALACDQNRVVLTYNNADFVDLVSNQPDHPGVLLVYQDNKASDMNAADIVKTIANVAATYSDGIASETIVLNGFRW